MHYYTTPGAEDLTKSENFTYDQQGRLSAAQTGVVNSTSGAKTWSLQWTYDRFGNRLTQSMLAGDPSFPVGQPNLMVSSATNQITHSGYTYDYAGNMTHDATATYVYDGANRLTTINTTGAVYSYFGPQRIKKVVGSTTTRYIYSGSKPIAEYVNGANASSPNTEYIYAGSQLLVTIAGSATTYHHPDHLSNRAETNSSGTRTRTFGQLPFGETWYETGTADKWKFTSYERDSGTGETGLDYANFRYYASGQGRFMSADLMSGNRGAPQSLKHYSYALNDPINKFDPLGLVPMSIDFTVCETPFITQVYDDGHTETITGSEVCNTFSMLVDFGWGGGDGGSGGGGGGGSEPRDPKDSSQPLHCDKDFKRIAEAALAMTNYGSAGGGRGEAFFSVSDNGNFTGTQYSPMAEGGIPLNFGSNTLAIFHTHGNNMSPYPSTSYPKGDIYSPVPNYVYSGTGGKDGTRTLYVTDPKTKSAVGPLDLSGKDCDFAPGFSFAPSESYT